MSLVVAFRLVARSFRQRVTSPVPELPQITYITGLSVSTTDNDGVDHTIVITVKHPHMLESSCPGGVFPCLADGSLDVVLDGHEELKAPGSVVLGRDVLISAANLPGECRSFGFENYWERKNSRPRWRTAAAWMTPSAWRSGFSWYVSWN